MKTVAYEEFLKFKPCWLKYEGGADRIKAYFDRFGGRMSALDILNLDDVSAVDKLWSVLREEFIPAPILHEFACVCAEYALSLIDNPDPRSIKAVEVKRAWLRSEATDKELDAARTAAWAAADAAWCAASDAAWAAAKAAAEADDKDATSAARDAARYAVNVAAWKAARKAARAAARDAARYSAVDAARYAAEAAASADREAQVAYLIMTLEEEV